MAQKAKIVALRNIKLEGFDDHQGVGGARNRCGDVYRLQFFTHGKAKIQMLKQRQKQRLKVSGAFYSDLKQWYISPPAGRR